MRRNELFRRLLTVFLVCAVLLLVPGCSLKIPDGIRTKKLHGAPVTEDIPLTYDGEKGLLLKINLTLAGTETCPVRIYPAGEDTPHAVVTYPADFAENGFVCENTDGALIVSADPAYRYTADGFSLAVYAALGECSLSGEAELSADCGGTGPDEVRFAVSGAAACNFRDIAAQHLTLSVTGAADVVLSGKADVLDASISGTGEIDAAALACADCTVSVAGAGAVEVNASDTLDVSVTGAGSVTYLGEPQITKHILGAGAVTPAAS